MTALLRFTLLLLSLSLLLAACKEEKEELRPLTAAAYVPTRPGQFSVFRLDSLVFTNAGRNEVTRSYQERWQVDAQVTDNLGRPSYRMYRSLRNADGNSAWAAGGTFFITPTEGALEMIENNRRTVKLAMPLRTGATWRGGRFVSDEPYRTEYNFSNDDNFADWDYRITETGGAFTYGGAAAAAIDSVITVTAIDESINAPVTVPSAFGARSLLTERWAPGVGLVYQEYILWEYQPNPGSSGFKVGFGVKRSLIDHN